MCTATMANSFADGDACPEGSSRAKRFRSQFYQERVSLLRSQIGPEVPSVKELIFNFQLGKALRPSGELVVVVESRDWPAIFAFRAVTAYISWMGLNRRVPVPRGYDWR